MLALEDLLKKMGHEVAIFAMQHPDNLPAAHASYFPDEVDFHNRRHVLKALCRPLGLSSVGQRFARLIDEFHPDIIHFNNIHSQLSPSIVRVAHQRGIATVWTTHDYKLLCPRYDCLQCGTTPCTECSRDSRAVLRHRCMKGSLPASILAYAEAVRWQRRRVANWVDAFVAPSAFMQQQLVAAGIPAEKVHHIAHFMDVERCAAPELHRQDYYCFVGRLSPEKGVETLLQAATRLGKPLKVIGDGPLRESLQSKYGSPTIEFTGFLPWQQIMQLVGNARCVVVPSEWYEVFGLVNMEAHCLGTPVIGARIGGIPELITPQNGILFTPGNVDELQRAVVTAWQSSYDYAEIARVARQNYSQQRYYDQLMQLYTQVLHR
jgi:glycosyltransferase involved in cell wall biosynthesis